MLIRQISPINFGFGQSGLIRSDKVMPSALLAVFDVDGNGMLVPNKEMTRITNTFEIWAPNRPLEPHVRKSIVSTGPGDNVNGQDEERVERANNPARTALLFRHKCFAM